jgi:hypothetical protein
MFGCFDHCWLHCASRVIVGCWHEWFIFGMVFVETVSKYMFEDIPADRSSRDMMISAVVGGSAIEFEMITRLRS